MYTGTGFRPLPRLISTYTRKELEQAGFGWVFPAPLEVNRLFYRNGDPYIFHPLFPAPREVDRYLYKAIKKAALSVMEFPAPLEVDRFLYVKE